jgi:hypothetical protein
MTLVFTPFSGVRRKPSRMLLAVLQPITAENALKAGPAGPGLQRFTNRVLQSRDSARGPQPRQTAWYSRTGPAGSSQVTLTIRSPPADAPTTSTGVD